MYVWEVSDQDNTTLASEIHDRLKSAIEPDVGPAEKRGVVIGARDPSGLLAGGMRGFSHWGWLYISHLWVREDLRSKGLGAELIRRVEAEAHARKCTGVYVDTFSAAAVSFYKQNGFIECGRIPNFPEGRDRTYLRKPCASD
jgi:ribosomal protein S18 acetylase RimI-like enzyme